MPLDMSKPDAGIERIVKIKSLCNRHAELSKQLATTRHIQQGIARGEPLRIGISGVFITADNRQGFADLLHGQVQAIITELNATEQALIAIEYVVDGHNATLC